MSDRPRVVLAIHTPELGEIKLIRVLRALSMDRTFGWKRHCATEARSRIFENNRTAFVYVNI